jgi:hydroxypyruvate reductase
VTRDSETLRRDGLQIWQAGLNAVRSDHLVESTVQVRGQTLLVGDESIDLTLVHRIAIVGAGKAGAGMAAGLERALGQRVLVDKQVSGWVNVPADCARPLAHVRLHPARPAGINEPTAEGVEGAEEILRIVGGLGPNDLCFVLISGGGSALLPAPAPGVTLADKLAVTRHLSAAGANIAELNSVRRQLSRIKGGGLARACRAGRLFALIISDVPGDPLDVIASGPTVDNRSTAHDALEVLTRYDARRAPPAVMEYLRRAAGDSTRGSAKSESAPPTCQVTNLVIGNNALAVDTAGMVAERLGYSHAMIVAAEPEGSAESVGQHLAAMARTMLAGPGPNCLISGGEPVVKLVPADRRGKGGRNQQLVLAAGIELAGLAGVFILSGGTDGEDGPTDAAGAWIDAGVLAQATAAGLDPRAFLERNDAYHFFEPLGALIKTGPTDTNVCDVRVVLVAR